MEQLPTTRFRDSKILSTIVGEEEENDDTNSCENLNKDETSNYNTPDNKTPIIQRNNAVLPGNNNPRPTNPHHEREDDDEICSVAEAVRENRKSFIHYEISHSRKNLRNINNESLNSSSDICPKPIDDNEDSDINYKQTLSSVKGESSNSASSSSKILENVDDRKSSTIRIQVSLGSNNVSSFDIDNPNISLSSVKNPQNVNDVNDSESNLSTVEVQYEPKEMESNSIVQDRNENDNTNNIEDENNLTYDKDHKTRLKSLPLRSPTPPRSSPRKSSKTNKVKDKVNSNSPDKKNKLLNQSNELNEQIPIDREFEDATCTNDTADQTLINSDSSEKDKGATKVTADNNRVGIQNLVVDGAIQKNFIVIHPQDESNSIGLAPLSSPMSSSNTSHALKSQVSGFINIKGLSSKKCLSVSSGLSSPVTKRLITQAPSSPNLSHSNRRSSSSSQSSYKSSINVSHASILEMTDPFKINGSEKLSKVDCDSVSVLEKDFDQCTPPITTSKLCSVM